MSRVITFSRTFPSYHPRKGEPTYFVEKVLNSFLMAGYDIYTKDTPTEFLQTLSGNLFDPKHHTIRRGNRWKVGGKFSPRVWSGKPYVSKQIIIAPDIEIRRIVNFEMDLNGVYSLDGKYISEDKVYKALAKNDGLTEDNMFQWLMPNYEKPVYFSGQVLIWNDHKLPY